MFCCYFINMTFKMGNEALSVKWRRAWELSFLSFEVGLNSYFIVCYLSGGPGSGKGTQVKSIVERYKGSAHISMGDIIRTEIATKGSADEKWGMIGTLVQKGEMAPEVRFL